MITVADDVKVFISWSGQQAKEVALLMREWLPKLSDYFKPWMSEKDITAGGRSMQELFEQIDETYYGLVLLTPENQNSAWLNFEAGALSKQVREGFSSRVVPLLLNIPNPSSMQQGPLKEFQARGMNETDLLNVVLQLARQVQADPDLVKGRFDNEWVAFKQRVDNINARAHTKGQVAAAPSDRELIEELLDRTRDVQERVRSVASSSRSANELADLRMDQDAASFLAQAFELDVLEVRHYSNASHEVIFDITVTTPSDSHSLKLASGALFRRYGHAAHFTQQHSLFEGLAEDG